MRNFKNILLVVLALNLSGCVFTGNVWAPEIDRDEVAKDLLINKDGTKVVLIGKKYDYFLNDDRQLTKKLSQGVGSRLVADVDYVKAKGERVKNFSLLFKAEIKNLSSNQVELLRSIGAKKWNENPILKLQYYGFSGFRTIAGAKVFEYQFPEYTSAGFLKDQKMAVVEEPTRLQVTGKVLVTPFTLVADMVLLPITIPRFIYHQVTESQTPRFCEGDFCGYDKLPKDSKSKK